MDLVSVLSWHGEPAVTAALVSVAGAGMLGAGAWFFRLLGRRARAVSAWAERMNTSARRVEDIYPEFRPNGGASLVDRVKNMRTEVELNRIAITSHGESIRDVCERLEGHRAEMMQATRDIRTDVAQVHRRIDAILSRLPLDEDGSIGGDGN